jgi:SAM-dependent methyltransferase
MARRAFEELLEASRFAAFQEVSLEQAPIAYRGIWERKPVLREIYLDIYRRMLAQAVPGPILEIGGGSGNFKAFAPDTTSIDVVPAPWLDVVCDAQRLPFSDASFANVVMVDVLHHIESSLTFLQEVQRILRPNGRLIFCEPAITPLSGVLYRLFHEEPVDMSVDPLAVLTFNPKKPPWDSNQAIPTLLVGRFHADLARLVPELVLETVERFSFAAYPLSGGFQPWCLLPEILVRPLLELEWQSRGLFGRLAAFRLLAVYRKSANE